MIDSSISCYRICPLCEVYYYGTVRDHRPFCSKDRTILSRFFWSNGEVTATPGAPTTVDSVWLVAIIR